jgi:hypothetical protein
MHCCVQRDLLWSKGRNQACPRSGSGSSGLSEPIVLTTSFLKLLKYEWKLRESVIPQEVMASLNRNERGIKRLRQFFAEGKRNYGIINSGNDRPVACHSRKLS